jgi:hypothetical protein
MCLRLSLVLFKHKCGAAVHKKRVCFSDKVLLTRGTKRTSLSMQTSG